MAHSEVVSQRLVRWLGLAVLAVALVVECTSEVDSLNEGASKWVWSPEVQGLSDGSAGETKKAAVETFKVLAKQAAKNTRKADEALEQKTESIEKIQDTLSTAKAKLEEEGKAVAKAEAGEALMKVVAKKAVTADASPVEAAAEEEQEVVQGKEKVKVLQKAVKDTEVKLEASKQVAQQEQKAKAQAASKAKALVTEEIENLSPAKAEKKAAALEVDQNLLTNQIGDVDKEVTAEKVKIAKGAAEMQDTQAEMSGLEKQGDVAKSTAIAVELKATARKEAGIAAAAEGSADKDAADVQRQQAQIAAIKVSTGKESGRDKKAVVVDKEKVAQEKKRLQKEKDSLKKEEGKASSLQSAEQKATSEAERKGSKVVSKQSSRAQSGNGQAKENKQKKDKQKADLAADVSAAEENSDAAGTAEKRQALISSKLAVKQAQAQAAAAKGKEAKAAAEKRLRSSQKAVQGAKKSLQKSKDTLEEEKQAEAVAKVDAASADKAVSKSGQVSAQKEGAVQSAKQ